MSTKVYTKQFVRVLPEIYEVQSYFMPAFGNVLQVADGVSETDTFMELKTIDADVTLNAYSTDANIGFGTGTGKTSRFGERKEIKAVNSKVKYEAPLSIHEGIDRFTVNDNEEQVVAERLIKHSEAWTEHINGLQSKELSEKASEEITGELTEAGVIKAFTDAAIKLTNNKVNRALVRRAYVSPQVYNIIVDSKLATTSKNSKTNIDDNEVYKFKGFTIVEVPEDLFQAGEQIYFAVDNVGVTGVGVQGVRTFESEDFFGVALQGAAKFAKFVPEKNKIGILKAKLTATA